MTRVRFVTATALFDGHDATINVIRKTLHKRGAEVVHLGHSRSAYEIVKSALEEDAHAIAVSSYQGGHMEFYPYLLELFRQCGIEKTRIFAGGGGVIIPDEKAALERLGVERVYLPEEGMQLGLFGMIDDMIERSRFSTTAEFFAGRGESALPGPADRLLLTKCLSLLTSAPEELEADPKLEARRAELERRLAGCDRKAPVIGFTGSGGAGKSSIIDEIVRRIRRDFPEAHVAIVAVDPSKRKSGGALLGDRIRMNSIYDDRVFMRSLAVESLERLYGLLPNLSRLLRQAGYDFVFVETPGIGQIDSGISEVVDFSIYVMTSEYGSFTQLEKINMLDFADIVALNKFEHKRCEDALNQVRKQFRNSRDIPRSTPDSELPVFGTVASRFHDEGVNLMYVELLRRIRAKFGIELRSGYEAEIDRDRAFSTDRVDAILPYDRIHYLGDISRSVREYHRKTEEDACTLGEIEALDTAAKLCPEQGEALKAKRDEISARMGRDVAPALECWDKEEKKYGGKAYRYEVRGREFEQELTAKSLSGLDIPKVALPKYGCRADIWRFLRRENLPGHFPFTAGVFPFKRTDEEPKRQFAGEGGPQRTNRRFHYLCEGEPAKRLSTAFDSVTLYGRDPHERPDIFGKVGESGVSIATLDDMKALFAGFDLCDANTSVSMTINGPAPIVLAMFFNTAIDQRLDAWRKEMSLAPDAEIPEDERRRIEAETLSQVRGTVQADILKEDQAQNTCIFSIDFALKLMGDVQEFLVKNRMKNYYSVSISGYHIAEAGANPITQLAFTLANGFTLVEYYLHRGMKIDDFGPNLSYFFSVGMDPEFSVIGRVARRIWAIAMRDVYGAAERTQKLKYHIQTSGRSLHAQEVQFNDIRTTVEALTAMFDNCNSLHTNAYDEAVTTPTEESVRRAVAIQLILAREFGVNKNQNCLQGSHFFEQLTDMVEEAVLQCFEELDHRGGVLKSMESQYQRGRIQNESLHYEQLKHSGELPLIGVNTFLRPDAGTGELKIEVRELSRSTPEEKNARLEEIRAFRRKGEAKSHEALRRLERVVRGNGNVFAELMDTVRHCTLGEITDLLFALGGEYRRAV